MPHWIASAFGLPGAFGLQRVGVDGRWPLHSYGCMRLRNSFVSRTSIYLDHNATAPLHPAARDAMCAAFDLCGNASSVHAEGRAARATIDTARAEVAAFAGTAPKNIVFTSGGTEALNLVLTPHIETPAKNQGRSTCSWRVPGNIRRSLQATVSRPCNLNLSV